MNKYEFEIRDGNRIIAGGVIYTNDETDLQNTLDMIISKQSAKKPKVKVRRKNKK